MPLRPPSLSTFWWPSHCPRILGYHSHLSWVPPRQGIRSSLLENTSGYSAGLVSATRLVWQRCCTCWRWFLHRAGLIFFFFYHDPPSFICQAQVLWAAQQAESILSSSPFPSPPNPYFHPSIHACKGEQEGTQWGTRQGLVGAPQAQGSSLKYSGHSGRGWWRLSRSVLGCSSGPAWLDSVSSTAGALHSSPAAGPQYKVPKQVLPLCDHRSRVVLAGGQTLGLGVGD